MAWVTLLIGLAKDLFQASYNVADEQRSRLVKIATGVCLLVVLSVMGVGLYTASLKLDTFNPLSEIVLKSQLTITRAFFAVGLFGASVLAAVLTFNVIEHTSQGKRLMVWSENALETEAVRAEKTANGGRLLAVLLVAAAIVFSGALR